VDDARLEALRRKAEPYSDRNGVPLRLVNTARKRLDGRFSYQVVLVPQVHWWRLRSTRAKTMGWWTYLPESRLQPAKRSISTPT